MYVFVTRALKKKPSPGTSREPGQEAERQVSMWWRLPQGKLKMHNTVEWVILASGCRAKQVEGELRGPEEVQPARAPSHTRLGRPLGRSPRCRQSLYCSINGAAVTENFFPLLLTVKIVLVLLRSPCQGAGQLHVTRSSCSCLLITDELTDVMETFVAT